MLVHLEPERVERDDGLGQRLRLDEPDPQSVPSPKAPSYGPSTEPLTM
jgi:hypothetical protein